MIIEFKLVALNEEKTDQMASGGGTQTGYGVDTSVRIHRITQSRMAVVVYVRQRHTTTVGQLTQHVRTAERKTT